MAISGTGNPFYAMALEEFTKALQKTGHQVLLVQVDSDHSLDGIVPRLASYRVDAIVSALPVLTKEAARAFAQIRIPDHLLQHAGEEPLGDVGLLGQRRRRGAVADLLVKRGARTFGFIAGARAATPATSACADTGPGSASTASRASPLRPATSSTRAASTPRSR